VLSFALGPEWRVLFFYHVNVAAGIMLPKRDAYATTAGIATLTLALGFLSGLAWLVVPAVALGLWATSFVGQVAAVAELRDAREELARLAVAEERLRFARDLHDLLGHSLSLITLKSELAGRLLPAAPEKAAAEVHDIESVARRALREVREAVAGYRRPTLEEELDGAREMLEAAGITCRIENSVDVSSTETDAVLAWVVREGATNVIRHSRARRCEIRLTRDDEEARAEITDDGRGQPPEPGKTADGSGLSGLAERVGALGGGFEAGPPPGGGFRLRVSLPLRETVTQVRQPASVREIVPGDGQR
jgi:two-component system sensor histidine kinase DesK